MSLQLGKEYFDVVANIDTSASRSGVSNAQQSQSQSQALTQPQIGDTSTISTPSIPHQGLSYIFAQHKSSAVLQVEQPITGFVSLRTTGLQSDTHRKLVRAVGQKHSKVARLRLAPETVMSQDPNAVTSEASKAAKKRARASAATSRTEPGVSHSRSRRDADEEEDSDDVEYERERRRRKRSTYAARSQQFVYSDDDDDEPEAQESGGDSDGESPRKKAALRKPKKSKIPVPGAGGDYEADDFVVEDPSEEEEEEEDSARKAPAEDEEEDDLEKLDRQIEAQEAHSRKKSGANEEGDVNVEDPESEGMDMSDAEGSSRTQAKAARTVAVPVGLDDDDEDGAGAAQASRKPGKKRIILEEDDDE